MGLRIVHMSNTDSFNQVPIGTTSFSGMCVCEHILYVVSIVRRQSAFSSCVVFLVGRIEYPSIQLGVTTIHAAVPSTQTITYTHMRKKNTKTIVNKKISI